MAMKTQKIIKKIKKFCKKLKRRFSGKDEKTCNEKNNGINTETCQTAALQAQASKPLPFISVFASLKVQKEQKSAFLIAGNDISKINSEACAPRSHQPENMAIDASVKIEVKNQDSDSS